MNFAWITEKVLVAIIGVCSTSAVGLYHLIDSKNRAQVEVELNNKYESIINENLAYKFTCHCDSVSKR